jgi:hypothetical protein
MVLNFGDVAHPNGVRIVAQTAPSTQEWCCPGKDPKVPWEFHEPPDFNKLAPSRGDSQAKVRLQPRERQATIAADISALIPEDGSDARFSIKFSCGAQIDFIGVDTSEQVPVRMVKLPLVSAVHSKHGDVTNKIADADGDYAEIIPGEHIELAFEYPEPEPGLERDFVIISRGHYVPWEKPASELANTGKSSSLTNYPNPFNPATTVMFNLVSASQVTLEVYNIMGQRVCTLVDGYRPPGRHEVTWHGTAADGTPAASGIYFCRLTTETEQKHLKMLLLR